ncbi:hemerythrin domain-containing protein [Pricia sp.]|uniref:hemerythrin domain-containing protein n=1 Tax=Pricia sp. TaxID=2268138 RepID=UPI0035935D19
MNPETKKPIKRNKDLQPLSRDHHHSLLLCWKIRTGFSKGVAAERIKCYADWFFEHHIHPHFEMEEKHLFPILGNSNELVKKAIAEHRRLGRLFNDTDEIPKSLSLIEEELERHIRFEERVLFNEVQKVATEEQLQTISKLHTDEKYIDNTDDPFWE